MCVIDEIIIDQEQELQQLAQDVVQQVYSIKDKKDYENMRIQQLDEIEKISNKS